MHYCSEKQTKASPLKTLSLETYFLFNCFWRLLFGLSFSDSLLAFNWKERKSSCRLPCGLAPQGCKGNTCSWAEPGSFPCSLKDTGAEQLPPSTATSAAQLCCPALSVRKKTLQEAWRALQHHLSWSAWAREPPTPQHQPQCPTDTTAAAARQTCSVCNTPGIANPRVNLSQQLHCDLCLHCTNFLQGMK